MQSEQRPRRYRRLAFDPPGPDAGAQTALLAGRGHLNYDEQLPMRIVAVSDRSEEDRMRVES